MAGTIEMMSPSFTGVASRANERTSSAFRNIDTKFRNLPSEPKRWRRSGGWSVTRFVSTSPTVVPFVLADAIPPPLLATGQGFAPRSTSRNTPHRDRVSEWRDGGRRRDPHLAEPSTEPVELECCPTGRRTTADGDD